MYRAFIFCSCLLISSLSYAAIYHWVDEQGNTHYSQTPPQDKAITWQKITVKAPKAADSKQQASIQDSANEIAQSNAERKATNDKLRQEAEEKRLAEEKCATSKKNLSKLDSGGNRLYKDADGNYSRFSAEEKNQQREKLNAFIDENCR